MKWLMLIVWSFLSVNVLAGTLYKWVDAEGNVQYSQTPPPQGTQPTIIKQPAPNKTTPAQNDAGSQEKKVEKPVSEEKKDKPATKETGQTEANKNLQETKQKNCEKATNDLKLLSSEQELVVADDKNPEKFKTLDKEARQKQLEETKAYFDTFCK